MQHRILIFNRQQLDKGELYNYLMDVRFETLCEQYQLDPALIEPARSNLEVIVSKENIVPYFIVKYRSDTDQPIIVYDWDIESDKGREFLVRILEGVITNEVTDALSAVESIIEVELEPGQLNDMGLLLAYEIARWAGNEGQGVILGLDNIWYRLNDHLAFIPIIST